MSELEPVVGGEQEVEKEVELEPVDADVSESDEVAQTIEDEAPAEDIV